MGRKQKFSRRLLFAIPAGLLATLLVFAAMEYLATMGKPSASDLDRYVKASRIRESEDPKPPANGTLIFYEDSVPFEDKTSIVVNGPARWPGPPELDPPFPSNTDHQQIPRDPEAVRKLLAEPDRPRNANWVLLKGAKPEYPPGPLRRGLAGHAVIEFIITERGRTANVRVVEQSNPAFGRAARRTVRDWLFIPRRENGRAVISETVRLRIEFRPRG